MGIRLVEFWEAAMRKLSLTDAENIRCKIPYLAYQVQRSHATVFKEMQLRRRLRGRCGERESALQNRGSCNDCQHHPEETSRLVEEEEEKHHK